MNRSLEYAADLLEAEAAPILDDPAGFVTKRLGEHVWSKQQAILESVRDNRYTAVPACHGPGKSFIAARTAGWWLSAWPAGQAFVVTTAPSFPQVRAILWREIRRAHSHGGLAGNVNQTEWFIDGELVAMGRKPADYDQSAFQGIHALAVLLIIDEACGVPKSIFDAGDSLVTTEASRVLAIGNPDDPASHFKTICDPDSGWNVIPISAFDTPNFTDEDCPPDVAQMLTQPLWVEERRKRWGEGSPLWTAKVLGQFPEDSSTSVIPYSWVKAAQDRWLALANADQRLEALIGLDETDSHARLRAISRSRDALPDFKGVGVDVADEGDDQTVMALRFGQVVAPLLYYPTGDLMQQTGRVGSLLKAFGDEASPAIIDSIGIGSGVVGRLREQGFHAIGFNAAKGTKGTDRHGEMEFMNRRAEAWWNLREYLDPANDEWICLPPDDQLAADLTAPTWRQHSSGKIIVEAKDEIRKRLGRSTDAGDAVVQVFYGPLADDEPFFSVL